VPCGQKGQGPSNSQQPSVLRSRELAGALCDQRPKRAGRSLECNLSVESGKTKLRDDCIPTSVQQRKKDREMTKINLDSLSLFELKFLQRSVAKAIAEYSERKKMEAIAVLEAQAKEFGFSLAELTGLKKRRQSSGRPEAKYRHPENSEITWSGRGRQPAWFKDAIQEGKTPESMAL
jgi:DNA-binding protein H-NS